MFNFGFKKDIDIIRRSHLAVAEAVDAWRIIPRLLVAGYSYMLYETVKWYMNLKPYLPEGVSDRISELTPEQIEILLIPAPTTQHAALVTAVIGISAAIFGLYSSSGKRWNGFTKWKGNDNVSTETTEVTIEKNKSFPGE